MTGAGRRIRFSRGAVISVVSTAIKTSTLKSRWPIRPALSPTLSAMSSVSPLVFTSTATAALSFGGSPPIRDAR